MTAIAASARLYQEHVNPQWVRLLEVLEMNVEYVRSEGAELWAADGRRILDFLSGYSVHNAGHNHPHIVDALRDELDRCGPAMLQSHVPELAGERSGIRRARKASVARSLRGVREDSSGNVRASTGDAAFPERIPDAGLRK